MLTGARGDATRIGSRTRRRARHGGDGQRHGRAAHSNAGAHDVRHVVDARVARRVDGGGEVDDGNGRVQGLAEELRPGAEEDAEDGAEDAGADAADEWLPGDPTAADVGGHDLRLPVEPLEALAHGRREAHRDGACQPLEPVALGCAPLPARRPRGGVEERGDATTSGAAQPWRERHLSVAVEVDGVRVLVAVRVRRRHGAPPHVTAGVEVIV